jgi:dUTP pyrophosphatase
MDAPLFVKLLDERATAPMRKSADAAGYDLCACQDAWVMPGSSELIDTGLAIAVPKGTYGRIAPRSGLAVRGIGVGAGVVDADYRGAVKVLLFNHATHPKLATPFEVKTGDRIAQLVLEVIRTPPVQVVDSLDDTQRGDAGFGSTGTA